MESVLISGYNLKKIKIVKIVLFCVIWLVFLNYLGQQRSLGAFFTKVG